jgi:general secretion pathway protein D
MTKLFYRAVQWLFLLLFSATILGCAGWKEHRDGMALIAAGKQAEGIASLRQAAELKPENVEFRTDWFVARDKYINQLIIVARQQIANGGFENARTTINSLETLGVDSNTIALQLAQLRSAVKIKQLQQSFDTALKTSDFEKGLSVIAELRRELAPANLIEGLMEKLNAAEAIKRKATAQASSGLLKPVSLALRDASILQAFDSLRAVSGFNFILDRDVRGDARITLAITNKPVGEVLKMIATTQKLVTRQIDQDTVFVLPNTPEKLKEYESNVARVFYLSTALASKVAPLLRSMTSAKEVFADERLNLLVVRDQPEGIKLAEQLIAALDVAEPEVMLELEVLEVSTSRLADIGIRWPDTISASISAPIVTGTSGGVSPTGSISLPALRNADSSFVQIQLPNPLIALNLRKTDGDVTVLANPRVRIKNKEIAKILIGERVPVITTSTTANVGTSESVSYLDVGLKLELEPAISLDNEVSMKVSLEVSSISGEVVRSSGLQAFRLGTRNASTSLRVKDGETQVLAGLIQKDERITANKVPGLGQLPLLGRLFSNTSDSGSRTEIVLLITPRVVRNISALGADQSTFLLPAELQGANSATTSGQNNLRGTPPTQSLPARPNQLNPSPTTLPITPVQVRPVVPVVPTQPPNNTPSK